MTSQLIYFMYITCFSHNLPLEYKVIDFLEHLVNGELSDLDCLDSGNEYSTKFYALYNMPFTTIIDTSFQNHLIYDRHPMSPYEYFKQYVPDALFDLMSDSTNIYAMQSGTLRFKPTSSGEIRTLIGLHLAMGVMKTPRVSMYWEAGMDIGIFQNTMCRDRFFQLRSHLYLVNNLERPAENNDVFYKVRPLYDAMRRRCLELPLEENLCVDEQMVPFRGSLSVEQYVKGKPHPWGVKIYFLCGKSGMAYDFLLHQGFKTQLGLGAGVVYHLSQRITEADHKLYFDNYFTTYNLLELKKIHAAGTARVCRFTNPPLQSDKVMTKMPRGSCDEAVSRDGKVALVKWFDSRSVVMASNFVGVGTMDEVQRWDKKQGRFLKVSRPEVVKLYNEAMGGVDLLNQLVSLYRTEIRSRKWTLRMITHAFDLAMNVAQCLVSVHKPVAAKRGRPSMSPEPQPHAHRPRVQDARPLPEVQYDMVDHMPNYYEKTEATRCKRPYCTGKTHVFCDKCNIHLCFVPHRNGFKAAHRK
uniref:PiggyBac transposable element-derived protein domain-containing protein n=1 Tax=Sinocyclocheilus grahami TaxID=75366 RepID=A0A672KZ53_SINGR